MDIIKKCLKCLPVLFLIISFSTLASTEIKVCARNDAGVVLRLCSQPNCHGHCSNKATLFRLAGPFHVVKDSDVYFCVADEGWNDDAMKLASKNDRKWKVTGIAGDIKVHDDGKC